jgi:hypothetical protein
MLNSGGNQSLAFGKYILKFFNTNRRHIVAVIVLVLLFQPLALASDNSNSKGTDTVKKAPVDLAELVLRLEAAEAAAVAARDAAAAANAHATDLEHKLEDMRNRLSETEQELKRYNANSATAAAAIRPKKQDETANKEAATQEETTEDTAEEITVNSLSDRLDVLQEEMELNKARVVEFGQTRVESGEKFNLRLFGTLLFNSYYNTAGTADPPTGLHLLSDNDRSLDNGSNFGATIRQTILGFTFFAPTIGRWQLSGDLQLDFFGGNPPVYNGRAFSPLRLRIARARLQHLEPLLDDEGNLVRLVPGRLAIVVGQDDPIISPLNPTSLAQVGFPAFADSGNLWSWTPQAKAIYHLINRERQRLTIEGGILAPYNGQTNFEFQFETRPDAGERGRLPAFQSRLSYQRGNVNAQTAGYLLFPDPPPFQIGIGGHYARHFGAPGRIINSAAVAGDYVIPVGKRLIFSGELFWGRSISGLGGGVVQGIVIPIYGTSTLGIRSRGGWSQLTVRPHSDVSLNFAYGIDDPYNEDLRGVRFDLPGATSRTANRSVSANILYRFRSNFIMSAEYRFMQTLFTESTIRHNHHINIGFGYQF